VLVLLLAVVVPFEMLAEWTSLATLLVFVLVNLSLLWLRHRRRKEPPNLFRVPLWVPAVGLLTSLAMMAASVLPA
jgi:APA family basic amino acid/polyamine antiporter